MLASYRTCAKNIQQSIYNHPVLLSENPYLSVLVEDSTYWPLLPSTMQIGAIERLARPYAFVRLNQRFTEYRLYEACLQFIVDNAMCYQELLCLGDRVQQQQLQAFMADLRGVEHQLNQILDHAEYCRLSPRECRFLENLFIPQTVPPTSKPMFLDPALCNLPPRFGLLNGDRPGRFADKADHN